MSKKSGKTSKEQARNLYDEYLEMLESRQNSSSNLVDDGSVLLMKYDQATKMLEDVKNNVRKASSGTICAHTRLRTQLRALRDNLSAMVKLSLSMQKTASMKRKNELNNIEFDEDENES